MKKFLILLLLIGLPCFAYEYTYNATPNSYLLNKDFNKMTNMEKFLYVTEANPQDLINQHNFIGAYGQLEHALESFKDGDSRRYPAPYNTDYAVLQKLKYECYACSILYYMEFYQDALDDSYNKFFNHMDEFYKEVWAEYEYLPTLSAASQIAFANRFDSYTKQLEKFGYFKDYRNVDLYEAHAVSILRYVKDPIARRVIKSSAKYVTVYSTKYNNFNKEHLETMFNATDVVINRQK